MAETFSPIVTIPPAVRQAVYAANRWAWTERVGAIYAAWHSEEAAKLRAAGTDVTDSDAVAAHMKAMQGGMPE
jgi:hypothetical protein